MTVLRVVPPEELLAMRPRILDRAEARREVRSVLEGLELRLGIRVVVRDVRPARPATTLRTASMVDGRWGGKVTDPYRLES
jgi:hypothetical protein